MTRQLHFLIIIKTTLLSKAHDQSSIRFYGLVGTGWEFVMNNQYSIQTGIHARSLNGIPGKHALLQEGIIP